MTAIKYEPEPIDETAEPSPEEIEGWHFIGQVWQIQDAAESYVGGKLTENKLILILLTCTLNLNAIRNITRRRLAREKRG